MGFKDRLREKRVEANLTQAALAEKVSVTARTIQNYELGSRKPTKYEVVKKIADFGRGPILVFSNVVSIVPKASKCDEPPTSALQRLFYLYPIQRRED